MDALSFVGPDHATLMLRECLAVAGRCLKGFPVTGPRLSPQILTPQKGQADSPNVSHAKHLVRGSD